MLLKTPWPFQYTTHFGFNSFLLDGSGELAAYIGYLKIAGGGTKTIDTSGSSAFHIPISSRTFNTATSQVKVGFQGLADGPPVRADGSYVGASVTLDQGTDTIDANTVNSWVPDSGSSTLSDGDLICVVVEMVTVAGADRITPAVHGAPAAIYPSVASFLGGSWTALFAGGGGIVLQFSDGTLGWFDNSGGIGWGSSTIWNSGSANEEYGLIFRTPDSTPCYIDGLWVPIRAQNATTSDFTVKLISDPEGTPTVLESFAMTAERWAQINTQSLGNFRLSAPRLLDADTDYLIAVEATGAGDVRVENVVLGNAAHRVVFPGGTSLRSVSRAGVTGAFGSSSTTTFPSMGVYISEIDFAEGGSGNQGISQGLHTIGSQVSA